MTLLAVLPLLVLFARAWIATLPGDLRQLVAVSGFWLLATIVANALVERLWFHRTEGILARDAQRCQDGIAYVLPLLLGGIAAAFGILALLGLFAADSVVWAGCTGVSAGLLLPFVRVHMRNGWSRFAPLRLRLLTHQQLSLTAAAALSAGVGIVSLAIPSAHHLDAVAVALYAVGVVLLTGAVDARVVRYMTLVGHGSASLLGHWLPRQIALLGPLVAVLLAAQEPVSATVAATIAAALPMVTALRIFAYRAVSRLMADWTVAIITLVAVYAGFTALPLGPTVMVGATIWLSRRGADAKWLLA
ncbi:hypothetical protein [Erythrobacter sp. BLCC-B19]|uniref:hypothetical protein n=1 Tax=Erythrobacter sp. BLCC-B19 TaxID=3025315 RepID=UPI002361799D|nr:hypothetical protein [Erythrobacter sp. BLCC-B19]WDA41282.1 hypothetical protein PS060_00315 [Erythrobacter sp. BLCC-B19]